HAVAVHRRMTRPGDDGARPAGRDDLHAAELRLDAGEQALGRGSETLAAGAEAGRRVAAQRPLRIALMMVMRGGRLHMRPLVPMLCFGGRCSSRDDCDTNRDGNEPFGHDHLKFFVGEAGPPCRTMHEVRTPIVQRSGEEGQRYAMITSLLYWY